MRDFIERVAAQPGSHNTDAWFDDAECAANDAAVGEMIIIEMRGYQTRSGNPETLRLDSDHFRWMVQA